MVEEVKRVFWPSSVAVFGPTTPKKKTPQLTIMEPSTVYGVSKLAGERWCEYYNRKYNLDIRSIRYPGLISYKTEAGGGTTDYAVEIFYEAIKKNRYECFLKKDTALPTGWYQVKHEDYTNSGYDRGHMVRSEERTKTVEDNISTFFMTNILPQRPDLNRGVWLDLEYYCEDLCKKQNKELYIVAGGIFHSDSTLKGEGIVPVPDSCFKIIVVLEKGQGLKNVSTSTEVISVVIPNIDGISKDDWEKYKTTVRKIEGSTGYDFLNSVSKAVQDVIEKK